MDFHDSNQVFFEKKNKATARRSFAAFSVVTMAVGIGLGILIGRYAICDEKSNSDDSEQLPYNTEADPRISEEIINHIDAAKIREYLR